MIELQMIMCAKIKQIERKAWRVQRGMTLVELLITLAIFVTVMVAVGTFEANTFIYQGNVSSSFTTAQNAQIILKTMLTELRETAPGVNGAYALVSTGSTSISFFSDPDNDGQTEQITYSLTGTTLSRSVIQPSGSPLGYNGGPVISTLLTTVRNGNTTPVFQYFDTNYNGTSSPLAQPVTTTAVRLVKVNVTLDTDPNRSPVPITYTVQANLRNLKNNL
jgi:prepilin-type N-terminal cleavage/methylation domain-containing protein